jgi:hypothetical protein
MHQIAKGSNQSVITDTTYTGANSSLTTAILGKPGHDKLPNKKVWTAAPGMKNTKANIPSRLLSVTMTMPSSSLSSRKDNRFGTLPELVTVGTLGSFFYNCQREKGLEFSMN